MKARNLSVGFFGPEGFVLLSNYSYNSYRISQLNVFVLRKERAPLLNIKQVSKTLQLKNLYPLHSQDFPPPTHVARTFIENKSSLLQITFIWEDVKFSIKINISRPRLIVSQPFPLSFHFSLSPWLTLHYLLGVGVTIQPNPPPMNYAANGQPFPLSFHSPFSPWLTLLAWGWSYNNSKSPPPFFIYMCLNFRCLH